MTGGRVTYGLGAPIRSPLPIRKSPRIVGPFGRGILTYSKAGTISVRVGGGPIFIFPFDATLQQVRATAGTAPVGDDILLDLNKNGVSILPSQVAILDGTQVSAIVVPTTTAMNSSDQLTLDIDQVGSGVRGRDLTVIIEWV